MFPERDMNVPNTIEDYSTSCQLAGGRDFIDIVNVKQPAESAYPTISSIVALSLLPSRYLPSLSLILNN